MTKEEKENEREATVWISGLDRIHASRRILACYDFSATPFAPSGNKNDSEALFTWIISDFGLNDGIESGLVKTPRIVVRDDNTPAAKTFRSKLYHIYADDTVRDNVKQAAEPRVPLPDMVLQAYNLLGADWFETYKNWKKAKSPVPPVMITVANRTETAARIKYAFEHNRISTEELCDSRYIIHIDSKTLEKDENESIKIDDILSGDDDGEGGRKYSKKEQIALLRETVDTVGRPGKRGERYLESDRIRIDPPLFAMDKLRVRIMLMLNMSRIVEHLWNFIRLRETEQIVPVFDPNSKIRSTGHMPAWWTSKHREPTVKSHITHCVHDSAWEAAEAYKIEKNPHVTAWAKNDHLGFGILYTFEGVPHYYYPDFLIKLDNEKILVLETKGQDNSLVQKKRRAIAEWVEAVNSLKEYGQWHCDISFNVADIDGIIEKYTGK
ncbi:MAG: hypothetical protein LBD47_13350 [Treponema sp.]|nr:hypothetical protein [Treponema sp.]